MPGEFDFPIFGYGDDADDDDFDDDDRDPTRDFDPSGQLEWLADEAQNVQEEN